MAEAMALMGAVSSGVQFIDFGGRVLLHCYELIKRIKDAPKNVRERLAELEKSLGCMQRVRSEMERLVGSSLDRTQLDNVASSAAEIKATAEELQQMLENILPNPSKSNMLVKSWSAIMIVIKGEKIQKMMDKIERQNNHLSNEFKIAGIVLSETNR
jgi:N-terminal domain on NACHT_NTPase and P-loop NTPases